MASGRRRVELTAIFALADAARARRVNPQADLVASGFPRNGLVCGSARFAWENAAPILAASNVAPDPTQGFFSFVMMESATGIGGIPARANRPHFHHVRLSHLCSADRDCPREILRQFYPNRRWGTPVRLLLGPDRIVAVSRRPPAADALRPGCAVVLNAWLPAIGGASDGTPSPGNNTGSSVGVRSSGRNPCTDTSVVGSVNLWPTTTVGEYAGSDPREARSRWGRPSGSVKAARALSFRPFQQALHVSHSNSSPHLWRPPQRYIRLGTPSTDPKSIARRRATKETEKETVEISLRPYGEDDGKGEGEADDPRRCGQLNR
jgi:hypothetical protein